ncbi:MAG: SMC-Scp complex subunit ScpB [Gammaproteobacteria bacterium]|nr:SMC-Scp complex subunit ScpB [Gammaproteobacteria bacterium]
MSMNRDRLKQIVEGALLAAGRPLSIDQLLSLFMDEEQPSREEIREAIDSLKADCESRAVELVEVSTGFRYQVRSALATWIARLWEEKPPRYSRAVLETLALIAYRQPITRAEIEDVRGVSVGSNIVKTLMEREWVRIVGHRDVPGKPALFGTTRQFLDYFNLKNLSDLPTLADLKNIDSIEHALDFGPEPGKEDAANEPDAAAAGAEVLESLLETETPADGEAMPASAELATTAETEEALVFEMEKVNVEEEELETEAMASN